MKPFSLICGICLVFPFILNTANAQDTSTLVFHENLKAARTDSAKMFVYFKFFNYFIEHNRRDSALFYIEKAAIASLKTKNQLRLGDIYNQVAIIHRQNEHYDKSLEFYQKSIEEHRKKQHPNEFVARNNKASLFLIKAEYSKALSELMLSLKAYEKLKDNIGLGDTYKLIGRVYANTGDNQKALEYYQDAKKILEKEKDFFSLSATYEAIGSVYQSLLKFEQAIDYHEHQLKLATDNNLESHKATALNNIGLCYFELGQHLKAIDYYKKSLEIRKNINSKEGIISCLQKLSRAYLALNKYQEAAAYEQAASEIVESSSKNPKILAEMYKNLYELNEKIGKDKYAFLYYKKYTVLQDSVDGKKQVQEIARIREMYEAEKKQNEINTLSSKLKLEEAESERQEQLNSLLDFEKSNFELSNKLLNKEKTLQNLQIATQKKNLEANQFSLKAKDLALSQEQIIKWLLLGFMTMLLALVGFVYFNYHKEKQIKQSIEKAKNEIETKNIELDQLNKTKDKLFSVIVQDLKSPVADLQYFVKPFFEKHIDSKEASKINQKLSDLNTTMDNVLVWALQQTKGFKLQLREENIPEIIESSLSSFDSQLASKGISIVRKINPVKAIVDERKMEIVLRNILTNAIKFTPKGGFIKISCEEESEIFEIIINDTGVGMTSEQLQIALQGLSSSDGTNGEKGTGLGLLISKEFIALHKGQMVISSSPEEGTKVAIRLPKRLPII